MADVLFLAHRVPFPPDRGDKIRGYHMLRHLSTRARVHLLAFGDTPADLTRPPDLPLASCTVLPRRKPQWHAALEALATRRPVSVAAYADPTMHAATAAVGRVDAVHVFSSQMAQYVPAEAAARVVMDFCDVDAAKFAEYGRTGRGPRAWAMRREGALLLAHDRAVAARADASLFVSEAEAALFRRLTGAPRVVAIENGIDTARFDPAAPSAPVVAPQPLIVFTGQMDYPPNVEAVRWFVGDILPRVPAAHFAIVGRAPTPAVRALAGPRVTVTGEVADVRGWLAAAAVVVAPLRLARGVQNKVLEAMAMARPVVASAAAAEGIDHGGTIRVGADAAALAAAVSDLLADRAAADALGRRARAQAIARYGWDARLAALGPLLGLPDLDSARPLAQERAA